MDWDDLAGWGLDLADGAVPDLGGAPRESPNVVISGWLGAFAGGAAGVILALALLHPIPPAGTFELSLESMTRQRFWGTLVGLFGGMMLGSGLGRVFARRFID